MADNIASRFLSSAQNNNSSIAFRYFDASWEKVSYGEVLSHAKFLCAAIGDSCAGEGDRVAIISENSPDWCATYMAILFGRCIAVPVDMQLGPQEIKNILFDADVKIVFFSSKTGSAVLKAIEGTAINGIDFDSLKMPESDDTVLELAVDAAPDDLASIIYTSGTTGNPKGVMLTHRNFCSDADAVIRAGLVSENDNVLSILPMHHTYPFMCTFIVPIIIGATVTFGPGLKATELVSAIRDGGVTVVVGVPRLFEMIRNGIVAKIKGKKLASALLLKMMSLCGSIRRTAHVNLGKIIFSAVHENFRRVRFFASGGARLDPTVMKDLEALGFTVLEGYGLTETSPVIAFNPIAKRMPGSVGVAMPGAELRIVDGEIAAKGPMVMAGYYKNIKATEEVLREGWFHTGDLGYIDKDGYLFITGRKKEVIVFSSGKNIYPEDVEREYLHISLIKEIAVAGIEKNGVVESIQAIIVPDLDYARQHNIGNISETLKWELNEVTSRVPEYMRIRGFMLSSEPLPRTSLGKLRRFMLKDIMAGAASSAKAERTADAALLEDEIGRKVVGCINSVLNENVPVRSEDNLELDLGFDSLKRIEFISSLEDAFSVSFSETFISDVQTVGDVVLRIREYTGEKRPDRASGVTWKEILEKEPPQEDRGKTWFYHSPIEKGAVYLLFMGLKIFFRLFFHMTITGRENITGIGPYILAANHSSYLDGFVVGVAVPYRTFENLYFLGISKFFAGSIKQVFASVSHVIPIDAEAYLNRALQMSSYVIGRGKSLCIFPEGGRPFGDEMLPFKKGVGILAIEKNIPVIPVYIDGSSKALPRGAAFIKPAKIRVIFGRPFGVNDIDVKRQQPSVDEYQLFADQLRERVLALSK
jgi:long-chain acyl-CoA synthetase